MNLLNNASKKEYIKIIEIKTSEKQLNNKLILYSIAEKKNNKKFLISFNQKIG